MKAGRTGSTPGDVTKIQSLESDALRILRNDIGNASFSLNTVVVGLDAVEKGHKKPNTINVTWAPKNRADAARRARRFTVEAFIVRAAEALKSYRYTISRLPQFKDLRDKWEYTEGVDKVGAAGKLEELCERIIDKGNYLVVAGKLLIVWRNKISHVEDLTFDECDVDILRRNAKEISDNYSSLNVDRLLSNLETGKPTLKDVSSLISMTINLAKKIDTSVYDSIKKEDVLSLVDYYGLVEIIRSIKQDTPLPKIENSIKRAFMSRAPRLYSHFLKFYAPDGSDFHAN